MADEIRRLRRTKETPGFAETLEIRGAKKNTVTATALGALPSRWLYYGIEPGPEEHIILMAVHDHLHEQ